MDQQRMLEKGRCLTCIAHAYSSIPLRRESLWSCPSSSCWLTIPFSPITEYHAVHRLIACMAVTVAVPGKCVPAYEIVVNV